MSKKSSKTSHVLNLITNRIGTPEDGELDVIQEESSFPDEDSSFSDATLTPEEEWNAPFTSDPSHLGSNAATDPEPIIPVDKEDLTGMVDLFAEEPLTDPVPAALESEHVSPSPAIVAENPLATSPAPAEESIPVSPPSVSERSGTNLVSDRIRQELENQLEASISPMTLQDFSDPRQQRNVELPLHSGSLPSKDPVNDAYATDDEEYVYVNIMEELVTLEYANLMERIGVCMCKRCRNDVIAISLNKLPTKYVVTKRGYLLSKLSSYNMQYHTDVVSTITGACLRVKKYPNHDENMDNMK